MKESWFTKAGKKIDFTLLGLVLVCIFWVLPSGFEYCEFALFDSTLIPSWKTGSGFYGMALIKIERKSMWPMPRDSKEMEKSRFIEKMVR